MYIDAGTLADPFELKYPNMIRVRPLHSHKCRLWWCRPKYKTLLPTIRLKHYNSKLDFEENANKTRQTISNKLSNFVLEFIKQETDYLAQSIIHDPYSSQVIKSDNLPYQHLYSNLDTNIQRRLEGIPDEYHRLVALLSYNHILIHPEIYMSHYGNIKTRLDDQIQKLLIRRLAAHGRFEECFKIFFENQLSTLNDMEDFLDLVIGELEQKRNTDIGIYELLLACQSSALNQSSINSLVDSISYRNQYSNKKGFRIIEILLELQAVESIPELELFTISRKRDLSLDNVLRMFKYRKHHELIYSNKHVDELTKQNMLKALVNEIYDDKPAFQTAGFLSLFISSTPLGLPQTPTNENVNPIEPNILLSVLYKAIFKDKKLSFNDYDALHLVRNCPPQHFKNLYILLHRNSISKLHNSPYIISYFAALLTSGKDLQTLYLFSSKYSSLINQETSLHILSKLFPTANFKSFVKRLYKNPKEKNTIIAQKFIEQLNHKISITQLGTLLATFVKDEGLSTQFDNILKMLNRDNFTTDEILHCLEGLLDVSGPTRRQLLEIGRCALSRNNITNPEFMGPFFQRLLQRCWNKNTILQRISDPSTVTKSSDPFHTLYGNTSEAEKAKLHNTIRAFAQTLSLLNAEEIGLALNSINSFMHSDKFTFVNTQIGKKYVMDQLLYDTTRFIDRAHIKSPKQGVVKVRNILFKLNFDARIAQCALYRFIVKDDPHKCLQILNAYKGSTTTVRSDMMQDIMLGILTTHRLNGMDKLQLFEQFRKESMDSGFAISLKPRTIVKLIELIIDVTEKDPNKSLGSISWVLRYASDKKVPFDIIQSWKVKIFGNRGPMT